MDQQPNIRRLCDRCRIGLHFPGIESPELRPETFLEQNPPNKVDSNVRTWYYHSGELHKLTCNFALCDKLPHTATLTQGVDEGCVFCCFLRSLILRHISTHSPSYDAVTVYLEYLWDSRPMRNQAGELATRWVLEIALNFSSPKSYGYSTKYYWPLVRKSEGLHGQKLGMPTLNPRHSLGQNSLEFLQSNLHRCLKSCVHPRPGSKDFVPNRLIDISDACLRIIEAVDNSNRRQVSDAHYATLSYCWGTRDEGLSQLRLTKDSWPRLRSGFMLGEMSPVQKDAVMVARALGIPYIWIDALCIRQDDRSDWERESSLMHKIYGNSYLTICNLRTESCQQGFLSMEKNLEVDIPFDTQSRNNAEECYGIGPGYMSHFQSRIHEGKTWGGFEFSRNKWNSRIWTFQEAIMSTRLILFATSGLYFSGSQGLVWEYGRVLEQPALFSASSVLQGCSKAELYRKWNQEVAMQYSGRQTTYVSDTLPALSGIAQIFAALLKDEYVAGLWNGDLLSGLFWGLQGGLSSSLAGLITRLNGPYIGPSWSWVGRSMSLGSARQIRNFGPGPSYIYDTEHPSLGRVLCDELQAQTTPTGMDKFGTISSATLSIRGAVYPLALGCCHMPIPDKKDKLLFEVGDFCIERPGGRKLAFGYSLDFVPADDELDPDQSWKYKLTLVLIGTIIYWNSGLESDDEMPCGLIVHEADAENTYWRVGTFGPSAEDCSGPVCHLDLKFFQECENRSFKLI